MDETDTGRHQGEKGDGQVTSDITRCEIIGDFKHQLSKDFPGVL